MDNKGKVNLSLLLKFFFGGLLFGAIFNLAVSKNFVAREVAVFGLMAAAVEVLLTVFEQDSATKRMGKKLLAVALAFGLFISLRIGVMIILGLKPALTPSGYKHPLPEEVVANLWLIEFILTPVCVFLAVYFNKSVAAKKIAVIIAVLAIISMTVKINYPQLFEIKDAKINKAILTAQISTAQNSTKVIVKETFDKIFELDGSSLKINDLNDPLVRGTELVVGSKGIIKSGGYDYINIVISPRDDYELSQMNNLFVLTSDVVIKNNRKSGHDDAIPDVRLTDWKTCIVPAKEIEIIGNLPHGSRMRYRNYDGGLQVVTNYDNNGIPRSCLDDLPIPSKGKQWKVAVFESSNRQDMSISLSNPSEESITIEYQLEEVEK